MATYSNTTKTVSIESNLVVRRFFAATELVWLKRACLFLVSAIFILISLGGLVRNAGAGLSCPDWPLCYGRVIPPMDVKIFLEWLHRLIAGSVSLFLLGISTYVFFRSHLRAPLGKYCLLALVLLFSQVILGGMTVLGLLAPKWVTSHLAVGLAFFGTIIWLTLEAGRLSIIPSPKTPSSHERGSILLWLSVLATTAVYLQALLGGLVSSNYAGLACPDFPTCYGTWIPPLDGVVKFQFLHRLGALIATTLVSICVVVVALKSRANKAIKMSLQVIPVLLLLQITLGVSSVVLQLPILLSVAHLAVAAALFGKLLVLTHAIGVSSSE